MEMWKYTISQNKKYFRTRFEQYELLAHKDLLITREYFFIGHYDSTKKTKRRWCSIKEHELASVEISDVRYFSKYKPLIKELVNVNNKCSEANRRVLLNMAYKVLEEIGWPQSYINDKIYADCNKKA
jgi:hypothetical protein